MVNNYFLFTSKLFTPIVSVIDADLVMPNWKKPATFKVSFLTVFFLFLAVPSALKSSTKKLINSLFGSLIATRNYLLDSAAIAGRGGGGGGGHGGLASQIMEDLDFKILKNTQNIKVIAKQLQTIKILFNPIF